MDFSQYRKAYRALRWTLTAVLCISLLFQFDRAVCAQEQELSAKAVLKSIERGKDFLLQEQKENGSWSGPGNNYTPGVSCLAMMAIINCGMTTKDEPVQRGLKYLRSLRRPEPRGTYQTSLMIMALAAAKDGKRDLPLIQSLVERLEKSQVTTGPNAGGWSYGPGMAIGGGGVADRSNSQYAVLALRDAVHSGVPVSQKTWKLIKQYWQTQQSGDGGWGYQENGGSSRGSMTVAGIATMVIVNSMLGEELKINPDGTPVCCDEKEEDKSIERAIDWMTTHFTVGTNPGVNSWLLYYLYGLERAGRLSGTRFFGKHDWYREGAAFLTQRQSVRDGSWRGAGQLESNPVLGTSFVLLFLSKGLAPVLINKLEYKTERHVNLKPGAVPNWNHHQNDILNLTDALSGRPDWPKLLTWQTVNLDLAIQGGGVQILRQAPVLFISGLDNPGFGVKEVNILKQYVEQGGFIFAVDNCNGAGFDRGFRDLIQKMYPQGEAQLKRLTAEHPVFRCEYLLDAESVELYGVDVGCRTSIIYCPDDLACLWDKWMRFPSRDQSVNAKSMITRAVRIGTNVIAYATGREPPNKLDQEELASENGMQNQIERGFLQIAKIRHNGTWDAAPRALTNLLKALNQKAGMIASTKTPTLPASDPNLMQYPLLYMHGRSQFSLSKTEQSNLKQALENGAVLFADACCGSQPFDKSFRQLMQEMFPTKKFKRIPIDHPLFSEQTGYDVRRVRRRQMEVNDVNQPLKAETLVVEPLLEGIEIDGHLAVIYSKYDISCALEQQASVACAGYVPQDAANLALNIVRYALLQDIAYRKVMQPKEKAEYTGQ
ncbi:hypothetical protein Enr10x_43860 [Gimesia panareensis]|uniref:DUF4159 domain-containing protein n=1 Tax=Gimesia panareensis TaxID=2527978 RepID=A0A517QBN5_9PLAN|nr:DUF4159 domain-containing protein [Gimesia panareensis]QDT29037.1 hypothetical protein Enr10x_43860 [Gimesia panareensis]